MIVEKIKSRIYNLLDEDLKVVDFSFALPFSYVLVEGERGRSLGVAMSLVEEIRVYDSEFKSADVYEFLSGLDSVNIVEKTLAFATVNAISQYYLEPCECVDIFEELRRLEVEKVAVVGNIRPLVEKLRNCYKVFVFERNPKLIDENTLSDTLEYHLLPEMDAVFVSGTSLLNNTIDMILDRSKKAKLIILIGPTAQIHPTLVKDSDITHLASVRVVNLESALIGLKMGSWKRFEKSCEKYTVKV